MDFGTPIQWLAGSATGAAAEEAFAARRSRRETLRTDQHEGRSDLRVLRYNESFGGDAGLPKFKADLEAFIKHTLSQNYNGKSAPPLVLLSPIAQELLTDANLPSADAMPPPNTTNCEIHGWNEG